MLEWKELYKDLHPGDWKESVLSHLLHKTEGTMTGKVVGFTRHTVAPEDVGAFKDAFNKGRVEMERYSGYKTAIGQKLSLSGTTPSKNEGGVQPEEREEIVVLSGWASMEQYNDFRSSEKYGDYIQVRAWTKWFGRSVAQPIPLE